MKVFTIKFNEEDNKFERVLNDMTTDDLTQLIETKNPFTHFQKVRKKYFTLDCSEECNEVVDDLNSRLCQEGKMKDGCIRVTKCKTCGELFIVTPPNPEHKGYNTLPTHCRECRRIRRVANEVKGVSSKM